MNTLSGHTAARVWSSPARLRRVVPEALVDVDPVGRDAEREQLLGLDDDVLLVGGAAGVADPDGAGSRAGGRCVRGVHALKCSG
ncbi:hypothetical protein [Actinomadura mexicana]|uniref:hypothetical protein n=1 Tax=Actinomadura mexicana TaxID=134959 RepID=UPI001C52A492|nr:hypothetical protein [Actinomadura mexicana]